MIALLDSALQTTTLRVIDGLPPGGCFWQCETDDQKAHWLKLKEFYKRVHQSLKDYFEGKPAQHSRLTPSDREFYGLVRDRYLAFYQVIQWGWNYIETDAEKHGNLEYLKGFADSPGEALIRVIENECAALMQPAFSPYFRWSSSGIRTLAKLDREASAVVAQPNESLSQKDKNKLGTYKHKLKQEKQSTALLMNFWETCIAVCEENRARDVSLRRYLREYRKINGLLDAEILRRCHPSKNVRGEEWQRGQKKVLGRYGGV